MPSNLSDLTRGLALAVTVAVLGGCATSKEKPLPHGGNTMMDIWQQFNEAGIEFPFPQREIRIINNEPTSETPPPKVHIPTSKEATISNEPSSAQPQPDGASSVDNK